MSTFMSTLGPFRGQPQCLQAIVAINTRNHDPCVELSAERLHEYAGRSDSEDGPSEVETAIERDTHLTARQRRALIEVYRSFAGRSGPGSRGSRG